MAVQRHKTAKLGKYFHHKNKKYLLGRYVHAMQRPSLGMGMGTTIGAMVPAWVVMESLETYGWGQRWVESASEAVL